MSTRIIFYWTHKKGSQNVPQQCNYMNIILPIAGTVGTKSKLPFVGNGQTLELVLMDSSASLLTDWQSWDATLMRTPIKRSPATPTLKRGIVSMDTDAISLIKVTPSHSSLKDIETYLREEITLWLSNCSHWSNWTQKVCLAQKNPKAKPTSPLLKLGRIIPFLAI